MILPQAALFILIAHQGQQFSFAVFNPKKAYLLMGGYLISHLSWPENKGTRENKGNFGVKWTAR